MQTVFNLSFLPTVEKADAATGDFSIFRNNADTTALTTAPLNVGWDTTVTENSNIQLQGDTSSIDLAEGGKYLVMYNVWASDNVGTERRSVETYLTLDGIRTAYGGGAGYIRTSGGDDDSYNSGAAIIESVAGQDLEIVAVRDDTEASAVALRPGKNGVSVLRMKDSLDYLRVYKTTDTSGVDTNTSFTDVVWDANDEVDTGSFGFTNGSANVTLKGAEGNHFLVTSNVRLLQTAGSSNRLNYEMRLTLDGIEVPGSRVTTYLRGNPNSDGAYAGTLAYSGIIQKTSASDQTFNIEVRKESVGTTATTDIIASKTAMSLVALPDTGSYISLTSTTSAQTLSTTRTPFNWNDQIEADTAAFSHSTTTSNSRINFDATGNYLFFSTAYTSRTSNTLRSAPVIEWELDGGTLLTYGGHGSFNRGDQGSNDAFTSGSSGGLIINGVTDTQYLEVTHIDEAADTNNTFPAGGIAVQGILLDENFFGTDVVVSATGTHAVETDIPSTDFYGGGGFVITEKSSSRNVTSISVTESGTVDASTALNNIKLFYDLDTTGADGYDCSSESYGGGEAQFGATDTNGFSGANGVSSFSDSVSITTTQTMCVYVVFDVLATSTDGDTVLLSIDNPSTDVDASLSPSIGPVTSVSSAGSTTLRNAELTQVHYHWRNDDGNEANTGATSIDGTEDTPAIGFANGTTKRLRMEVSAEGSTSSMPTAYRLEYAQKSTTCSAVESWTDVGTGGGGDWDVVNTANLTDGSDTTLVTNAANGALTAENTTRLTPNGGQKDTSSQTGNITLTDTEYVEIEFALEPTVSAPQGNTYCFRVSDAGTSLRNYNVYPEGTISADIDVSASSSQVATLDLGTTGQYVGGTFVIERSGGNRTLTDITITESGTVDATLLSNPTLYYDLDTTNPRDCTGESYGGGETNVTGTSFSGTNGTSSFNGLSISISNAQSLCGYIVFDVGATTVNGETINIEIANPSVDVVVTTSSVGPSTSVSPAGSTTIAGPIPTQTHYHWRNDDGDETDTGATSATGAEDTAIVLVPKESTRRLRVQVSNEGAVDTSATNYQLEYGTKVTTCDAVGSWSQVGVGAAFATSASAFIADGNTLNLANVANGAMTDENTTFVGTGALRETSSDSGAIILTSTEFTELEYSIEATAASGYETDYCFRVTDSGTPLQAYTTYPELTTRQKQDFFVQKGTATITGTSLTINPGSAYTAPSATSSAFVRITNSQLTGAGDDVGTNGQVANSVTAYISDQSDITSGFTISRTGSVANTRVDWEIIEFVGLPGTDNEMIIRDVGELSMTATNFYATSSVVTGVVNDTDVVVFITGQRNQDAGTGNYNDGLFTANWVTSTSEAVFQRGDADITADVGYAVVEFTGANWKIQRIEHEYTVAGSTELEDLVAVTAPSQTFVHAQKRVDTGLPGIDEGGHKVWVSSMAFVSFELRSTANTPSGHHSVAWVVENTQTGNGAMKSQQTTGSIIAPGSEPQSSTYDIGDAVVVGNASIFATNYSEGTGTTYPRLQAAFNVASSTDFEVWQSDTNNDLFFQVEVVEWPVAETSIRQNYYRFYVDNDLLDPTDPWPVGVSDLGENTSITGANDPLGEGEQVRLRMSLLINNATLPAEVQSFKLQYGKRDTSCSAIGSWADVGGIGSGSIWRGYDGTLADGIELATETPVPGTLNLSVSDVAGTYEEENNTGVNPYAVDLGQDLEYDWHVEHNGATQLSDYCFRMVQGDGTVLDGYNNYPTLRTTGYTPIIGKWRWYDDATNITPVTSLGVEEETPVNLAPENEIKLRATAIEVEGAPGVNVKFKLQYSEYADFSTGINEVVASHLCVATSTWCYVDGAGVDTAVIDSTVLSDTDACVAGVGNGCGLHTEIATTTTTHVQPSLSSMEFEFTLKPKNPRVNAVYYFRLYDVTNDVSVGASSTYPSLQMEGSSLIFTLDGVDSGTTVGSVVTDATTTPITIAFEEIPFDTEYEAAHRLTVDTNATEGYQMLMFSDQNLTDSYGAVIPTVLGSNAAPTGWSTGCVASATACFGYHSTDPLLQGSSARFGADDTYAAFSASPEEIMYSSIPTDESHDMVYKIQVGQQQPAGQYTKTITYIAIPIF